MTWSALTLSEEGYRLVEPPAPPSQEAVVCEVPPYPEGDPWDQTANEVEDLAKLGDDWDGEGAIAPSPTLLVAVLQQWLPRLRGNGSAAPTRVSATRLGGVTLEWQAAGFLVELEVYESDRAHYLIVEPGAPTRTATLHVEQL